MERSNGLSKCAGQSLELLRSSTFRQFARSLVRLRKSLFGCCPWIDIVRVVGDAGCERAWDVSGSSFWLDPTPDAIRYVRFASTVASGHATLATKRALPLTWAGLPPAGSHQLAWRTHSITSSATLRTVGGNSMPSAWAVMRFTTRSNLVGCSTGISPGFAPRRILST